MTTQSFSQDKLEWLSPIEFKNKVEETPRVLQPIPTPVPDPIPNMPAKACDCVECNCKERFDLLYKEIEDLKFRLNKLEQKPVQSTTTSDQVVKPKIIMHTSATCLPCARWKKDEMPKFMAAGWDIEIVTVGMLNRMVPYFYVTFPGKQMYVFEGYLPIDQAVPR